MSLPDHPPSNDTRIVGEVQLGIGAFGYWLYRRGSRAFGLTVIGVYALSGFGGLDHYAVAPVCAHSMAMNATILGEVIAASVLLVVSVRTGMGCRSR